MTAAHDPMPCRPLAHRLHKQGKGQCEDDSMPSNVAAALEALTGSDVHIKRALGDAYATKSDGDDVSASLTGPVGAAINTVAFVLHHDLHAVLAALRISDHGGYVSRSRPYKHRIILKDLNSDINGPDVSLLSISVPKFAFLASPVSFMASPPP